MKKFKFYQFALALPAAVLFSAAASEINTAYAAPAASAAQIQDAVNSNTVDVGHRHWHRGHHRNRWVGPAVALGVFGAAAAATAGPGYYYNDPYYYRRAPRERCFVQTDPYGRGYWTWC